MPNQTYTIGTRGSLLALTQCGQIKDQLEKLTGDTFHLKVIKTQGDLIVDKPLWQLDGKDFFTKELDTALLLGEVDLVVHSYKDLGSERPQGIGLAAITKRHFAQDILFIKKQTLENLNQKQDFLVGTSSPRRIFNLENSLSEYLPSKAPLSVTTKMLRGNVNTRIQKLRDGDYDAIVLALPGIERLAETESSKKELEKLLKDLDYMVLPQSDFPSAASQGALGIEYSLSREDNGALLEKLQLLNDELTESEITRERQAFTGYGGGCHLAVGINVFKQKNYYLHIHKGTTEDKAIREIHLEGAFPAPALPIEKNSIFVGLPKEKLKGQFLADQYIEKVTIKDFPESSQWQDQHLYVTSSYCIPDSGLDKNYSGLFAAGTKTMKSLVKNGHWVHASADSRGDQYLKGILNSKALKIMHKNESNRTTVLSNNLSSSTLGKVLPTYKRQMNCDNNYKALLEKTSIFYWTSFFQYSEFVKLVPSIKEKFHCTGVGKTLDLFLENQITIRPFSSLEEFTNWSENL